MVSFWVYDVVFLVLFCVGVWWFLSRRKDELTREGWMFMWRTQFGVKAMDWFVGKFGFVLKRLKWLVVGLGFVLMGIMVWMLGRSAWIYLMYPEIVEAVKAPPIAPLIPYFPKLFGMESLFPAFYFTYFLVALAIVAISHEFSHGIFMRLFKIRIKSTGLVFLGPILGAFVEQSERSMGSKKRVEQMTVLGAGVFANVLMALLFYLLYVLFFFSSFSASGYAFNSYAYVSDVPIGSIDLVGNVSSEFSVVYADSVLTRNFTVVGYNGRDYLMSSSAIEAMGNYSDLVGYSTTLFELSPAVRSGLMGAIVEADGVAVLGEDVLREFMESSEPGDVVHFVTKDGDGESMEYDVVLGEHPVYEGRGYLGVAYVEGSSGGFVNKFLDWMMSFKDDDTYYEPKWDGEFVYFVYYLLWWVMVINLLVALFNMLPLGMLDGGRFLYLAIWGVSGKEKWGKFAFRVMTYFIFALFVLMMFFWFIRVI
jgi:membrane-associated protease RseP (regulator of RpoE activity)